MWLKVVLMAISLTQTRFDVGIGSAEFWRMIMYSAINNVMKSYITHASYKKIGNGYITSETKVVMW